MGTVKHIELRMDEIEQLLERAEHKQLHDEDYETLGKLVDSYVELTKLVRQKGTTIAKLRRLLGGLSTEKTRDVVKDDSTKPAKGASDETGSAGDETPEAPKDDGKPRKPGHGRNGASAYPGAERVGVAHETLASGDPCPECPKGKLYRINKPAVIVRITGQSPLKARIWELERLRCNLCGLVVTASAPQEAKGPKYDERAGSMIALLKYGTGLPFNRLDHLQANLGTPLPSSTQWDVVRAVAQVLLPVYIELVHRAAQGKVLHNDDTHAKILSLMGKRRDRLLEQGKLDKPERTGLFTSGIVSVDGALKIALFITGRQHAGENLEALLAQRAAELGPPIQMGDALSRNVPKSQPVVESNCVTHGRRKVVDEADNFPTECKHVLEQLGRVYKVDALCREQGLSEQERLAAHQRDSAPVMTDLQAWMQAQLDERCIEPNSGLGEAFTYMLKRWDKLTVFLRVPGAPLDNNIVERALKKAILHRKNALFFRSELGAHVGDLFMTLIYTAELHGESPFDYLTALQRHAEAMADDPAAWLPWRYRDTLARLETPQQAAHRA